MIDFDKHFVWGRHQSFSIFLNFYSQFCTLSSAYFMASAGMKPTIICSDSNQFLSDFDYQGADNNTQSDYNSDSYINNETSIWSNHSRLNIDSCELIAQNKCGTLKLETEFYSIANEWELICDRLGMLYQPASGQMIGVMIGAPIWGYLSDMYGRKRILAISWTAHAIALIISSFSPSFYWFCVGRFVIGLIAAGQESSSYVLACESLATNDRFKAFSLTGWSLSVIPVCLVNYVCGSWRMSSLVNGVLYLPGCCLVHFCAFESAHWLLNKQRQHEAAQVVNSVLRRNGKPEMDLEMLELGICQDEETQHQNGDTKAKANEKLLTESTPNERDEEIELNPERSHYHFWYLCYSWQLCIYTVALSVAWFTTCMLTMATAVNMGNLASSIHVNMLLFTSLGAVAEWITYFLSEHWHSLNIFSKPASESDQPKKLGRKPIFIALHLLSLLLYLSILVMLCFEPTELTRQLTRAAYILTGALFAPVWVLIFLFSAELYPTPIRNTATGAMSVSARIGGALAPQVIYLAQYSPVAATTFMSICFGSAAVMVWAWIHETRDRPLPETMPPKEDRICKCVSRTFDADEEQKHLENFVFIRCDMIGKHT